MIKGIWLVIAVGAVLTEARFKRHQEETLELVHVIFRHGDRTPDRNVIYKNDPYINETYYPVGHGQLTIAGKRKEYLVGKALRKRYWKFLGDFTLDSVDARCTDYNRTKMSLELVLASLFPPRGSLVWEEQLQWQPVPFNYWPIEEDHELADPIKHCPKYHKIYNDFLESPEGKKLFDGQEELINYLSQHTGQDMTSKSLAELYFTLTTEQENGFPHPEWAAKVYHNITQMAIMDYNVSTYTPELRKYSSGFLIKKIIDDTEAKIAGKIDTTKIFLYSAHEYNLAFLLRFFDIFYSHIPPYGSYILVEVHKINGVRGFKILYQDYSSPRPKRYKLPKCEHFCTLDKFKSIYKNYIPKSVKECFQ